MVLKRIGVLSCGKVSGFVYAILGLIIGTFVTLFALLGAAIGAAASGSDEAWIGALFGVGAIIIFPIFYGVLGFIMGIISAAIYNLVAGFAGGLEIELE